MFSRLCDFFLFLKEDILRTVWPDLLQKTDRSNFFKSYMMPSFDPYVLFSSKITPKVFWKGRDKSGWTYLALGESEKIFFSGVSSVTDICNCIDNHIDRDDTVAFYGGIAFDSLTQKKNNIWDNFGSACFIKPFLEIRKNDKQGISECRVYIPKIKIGKASYYEHIKKVLDDLSSWKGSTSTFIPTLLSKDSLNFSPSKDKWEQMFDRALTSLNNQLLSKIVLSRVLAFSLKDDFLDLGNFLASFSKWKGIFQVAIDFGDSAFVSLTPELLYERKKNIIYTEAIAGTDRRNGIFFSENEKEIQEHKYVTDTILNILNKYCSDITLMNREVLELAYLKHFCQKFSAKYQGSDATMIEALHPTPAISGKPKDLSMNYIRSLEETDRGWYSGVLFRWAYEDVVGVVAIRSLLKKFSQIYLFSGVGLVRGATSNNEWEELNLKLKPYLDIFNVSF